MRRLLLVGAVVAVPATLSAQSAAVPAQVPLDPVPAERIVYADATGVHEAYWAAIPEAAKRGLLPSADSYVRIVQENSGGGVTILPVNVGVRRGNYGLLFRWQQYRADYCQPANPGAGRVRVGVALEIEAQITTRKDGIAISNFGILGAAADADRVSGSITIRQIGLGNTSPTLATYLSNFALTREGVTKALEAIAVTKAVLENDKTVLTPHILSVTETSPGSCAQALPLAVRTKA